jgi:hypothetical protein
MHLCKIKISHIALRPYGSTVTTSLLTIEGIQFQFPQVTTLSIPIIHANASGTYKVPVHT